MSCTDCEKIKNRKNLVYEDELTAAFLNSKPSTAGHIVLYPKAHFPIIENIPEEMFGQLFSAANKLSVACFDVLEAHGTNILINNGVAAGQKTSHSQIHIIPRFENDGLNIHWQPNKTDEEELTKMQSLIKSELEKKEEVKATEPKKEQDIIHDEENYMLKQLERIP